MKSKKQLLGICFLLACINTSFAQVTFQKTYGGAGYDDFYSVQRTIDGGYIMVGAESSFSNGSSDIYLVKTDSVGDTAWTKTFGGTYQDVGYCVQQTNDGGYILTGSTNSVGPGFTIAFLIRTDVNGNYLWEKYYWASGGLGPSGGVGISVIQTVDGGYIIDCAALGNPAELLLIKTNSVGDTLWTKSYGMYVGAWGGSIRQTADNGYVVVGSQGSTIFYDVYLLKTDNSGNLIWKKTYGGNSIDDYGYSVEQTPDGGYILVGQQTSSGGGVYLIKTDSAGDTLWTKAYGGNNVDRGVSVQRTNDAGYIIGGGTMSFGAGGDGYLIKTDAIGDTLWTKVFGGLNADGISSVRQTSDSGYILAGSTYSNGAGLSDAYLIKTDSMGNSGCSENGTATIVRTPTTIVSASTAADTAVVIYTSMGTFSLPEGRGGITTTLCVNAGMDEAMEESLISVYPNPAQDFFITDISEKFIKAELEIHNLLGEKIYSVKLSHKREVIDCKKFTSGIYFINLRTGKKVMTKKLVVAK